MATATQATGSGLAIYRLSIKQFEKMIDAGVFPDGAHVELLGGILVDKMTKNPPHSIACGQTRDALLSVVPPGWFVDQESPIAVGRRDRPEPDVHVARGQRRDYLKRAPGPKSLALVVEVSDVTYVKDRGVKWRRDAAWGIVTYWIVNLAARRVEVYNNPTGRGSSACYATCVTYGPDDEAPVLLNGREVGRIAVRDILP